ncbi:hypothetical protein JHD46_06305 [Sulfurimonas sp. SAG-AH-194-C20]|nr:hypothetical protein [Sulfurimonas sp. SAG-AH-194-C20]MDF1879249.1 hypothetical protein [Sulfurimonas sp. SAG-AH-194-C20]
MKKELLLVSLMLTVTVGMSGCGTYTPESTAQEICEMFQDADLEGINEHANSYFIGLAENKKKAGLKRAQKSFSDCSDIKVKTIKNGGTSYNYEFKSKSMQRTQKFYLDIEKNTYTISF